MLATGLLATACGGESSGGDSDRPSVVVTYSVLGAVVRDVVGDAADVSVLMPDGIDPHDWEPSAKDIEAVSGADLVVANGLHLEPSLEDALEEAAADGVPVFFAGDHIDGRMIGDDGAEDPHLWMDPLAMRDVVAALAPELRAAGIDVGDRAMVVEADLERLSAELDAILGSVSPDRRELVTGHESLGYFADRYGFKLVGAVVPSASSQAEASAGELAALRETIEATGVDVIFTEIGAPPDVVDAIASETGARVVELGTHNLPEDGTYRTFMLDIANLVASALAG
ncbi:MAG: metal ABC transporter substrate-binding protein [Acidimicrobiia bacterium]